MTAQPAPGWTGVLAAANSTVIGAYCAYCAFASPTERWRGSWGPGGVPMCQHQACGEAAVPLSAPLATCLPPPSLPREGQVPLGTGQLNSQGRAPPSTAALYPLPQRRSLHLHVLLQQASMSPAHSCSCSWVDTELLVSRTRALYNVNLQDCPSPPLLTVAPAGGGDLMASGVKRTKELQRFPMGLYIIKHL